MADERKDESDKHSPATSDENSEFHRWLSGGDLGIAQEVDKADSRWSKYENTTSCLELMKEVRLCLCTL